MDELEKKVIEIIADELGLDPSQISLDSSFVEDLGADSLSVVSMIMRFDEEFGIETTDEDAEKIQTVRDAVEYLRAKLQQS